jgi:carbonic anhydrase
MKSPTSLWRKDFFASIPVFLLGVPLCLGIAHASGLPLVAGLLGGVIGGMIASGFSRSPYEVTGPSAALVAISLTSMQQLPSFNAFLFALVLAGLIQIALGKFRAGFLVRFVPNSVMKGTVFAIGLILILKELPHLLGYDVEEFGVENLLPFNENSFSLIHAGSMLVGLASLSAMLVWKKTLQNRFGFIPAALVSILVGTLLAALFTETGSSLALTADHLVNVPRVLADDSVFSIFQFPDLSQWLNLATYKTALMIAIVASIESLLTIQILEQMAPNRKVLSFSHELVAQGLGNTTAGLIGGIPVSSSLARGVVNLNAGAQTKNSGVLQGVWILISVVFLAPLMNIIPVASLAAILIATGFQIVDRNTLTDIFRKGWYQFVPFLATVAGILCFDLLVGIVLGMVTAFLFILRSSYYDSAFQIQRMNTVVRITLGEDVSFMLNAKLAKVLNELEEGTTVEIDGAKAQHIDAEIVEMIRLFKKEAQLKNITVVTGGIAALANEQVEVYQQMTKSYDELINNNRDWVLEKTNEDPEFFKRLGQGQAPQFLFIGCSDSRVPLETITKANPGEMFIHRNIANVVNLSDVNFLSVLQYSVEVLNVRHIIVCGHYECGGVKAALAHKSLGLIDNWILSVKMSFKDHQKELTSITDPYEREKRAIELHSTQQARNLHMNPIVQRAVAKYGFPKIHSWVYDIKSGYIKDLEVNFGSNAEFDAVFKFDL